jgi:hypothetical protein
VTPPTSNLPASSAVLQISVIGDMWIPTTASAVQQTARLITSVTPLDYTAATAGVQWSIDPAGIASIDQQGRLTPMAIGNATVTAKYGDKTGINQIRVLPDYSGTWTGQFRITGCSGGSDFRECPRMIAGAGAGSGTGFSDTPFYPFSVALSQFRDQVTGTVREPRATGDLQNPVTGIVRVNGQLVLEATTPKEADSLRVFNWASTVNANVTAMSGAFTKIEPYRNGFGTPYTIRTEHEFSGLSHAP